MRLPSKIGDLSINVTCASKFQILLGLDRGQLLRLKVQSVFDGVIQDYLRSGAKVVGGTEFRRTLDFMFFAEVLETKVRGLLINHHGLALHFGFLLVILNARTWSGDLIRSFIRIIEILLEVGHILVIFEVFDAYNILVVELVKVNMNWLILL